jgi:hypoxia up-regulated 1
MNVALALIVLVTA